MSHITIYTTPGCVYCKMTKAFLKEHNISYDEKDVSADAAARDEMVAKSQQMGVPVVDIDGAIVVGFDKTRLSELLHLQ
ncbi:MAG: glutathione S-transferase N-terminal domain-containing protein [Candidatus Liptonbacteria bacterium]|nr:glutathione S-transferase N-terminal domain-containing protein [Candidatus Liptonbacteria bacterium]